MTLSPATLGVCLVSGLSMSRAAPRSKSSGDALGFGVFLPGGERPRLGWEGIAFDEFASARLDLQRAVAPRHLAARQGEPRQALHLDPLEDVVVDRGEL